MRSAFVKRLTHSRPSPDRRSVPVTRYGDLPGGGTGRKTIGCANPDRSSWRAVALDHFHGVGLDLWWRSRHHTMSRTRRGASGRQSGSINRLRLRSPEHAAPALRSALRSQPAFAAWPITTRADIFRTPRPAMG